MFRVKIAYCYYFYTEELFDVFPVQLYKSQLFAFDGLLYGTGNNTFQL